MNELSYNDTSEAEGYVINQLSKNVNLNQWEKVFIRSIRNRIAGGDSLSKKQKSILSNLWEKY